MPIQEKVLLHVGYHKTGTTWLQNHVFNSSEFGLVSPMSIRETTDVIILPNDLDFSAETSEGAVAAALTRVASKDVVAVFSNERFSGHPHSGGYDSKIVADRLKGLFPNARILICIREQKKVILSCYNQYIKKGGAASIASYLNVSDRTRVPLFDFRYFMYHRLITYYQTLFGGENVLVLPYELFTQGGANYVSRILEFARGRPTVVPPNGVPTQDKSNRSLTGIELAVRRLMNFTVGYRSSINQFSILPLNKKRTDTLFEAIQGLNPLVPGSLNRAITARLEEKVSALVGSRYCESNRMTSQIIGIDLAQLGYQA
jgi:sulfotransferase family protein